MPVIMVAEVAVVAIQLVFVGLLHLVAGAVAVMGQVTKNLIQDLLYKIHSLTEYQIPVAVVVVLAKMAKLLPGLVHRHHQLRAQAGLG
jgi:hypothetical protein